MRRVLPYMGCREFALNQEFYSGSCLCPKFPRTSCKLLATTCAHEGSHSRASHFLAGRLPEDRFLRNGGLESPAPPALFATACEWKKVWANILQTHFLFHS